MFRRLLVLSIVFTLALGFMALPSQSKVKAQDVECYGSEGSEISILGIWAGEEEETFRAIISPVLDACELTLNYEGTRDLSTILDTRVQGDDAPDIASMANVAALTTYADQLVSLTDLNVNADNYNESWQALGSVDGDWVGLPVKTDIKSLVWYSPISFEIAGYEVPATWDDMVALMDQMNEDGDIPALAMGFESGGATGWTATDFVQDILLRTQGAEFTNGLATGATHWDDPGVVEAWEIYANWVENYGGGADAAITTPFADAILQPFTDPPEAWMVKQSGFAGSATIQPNFEDYVYGEDFAFFVLPTADGEPVEMQVGADFMAAFNNTPAVQAVIAYLSSAEGASAWAASGFDLTPNSAVDLESYSSPISADKAAALGAAPGVSFDVGDLITSGQVEFDGITAVVGGADAAETLAAVQEQVASDMMGDMEEE
jgi:alpha-glucoside transport system substrate-binding protein